MGFQKNKIQKSFKNQMKSIEKEMVRKEKQGIGYFASKIYKLKFYGDKPKENRNWILFFASEFLFILGAVIIFFLLLFGLFFGSLIIEALL